MNRQITLLSPATVANMVCGFDILGFALNEPFDKLIIRITNEPGVIIRNLDAYDLPVDARMNVIGVVLLAMLDAVHANFGLEVQSKKNIKPGSGIGSSAASAAGAAVGANILLGSPFNTDQLIGFAMEGEALASGSRHADNIAPAILGGITLIRSSSPPDIIRIKAPELHVSILHPLIEIKTSEARKLLRPEIPLGDAVTQWGNVAGLVAGLIQGDYELISRSLCDVVAEPLRKVLIPGFDEVKFNCLRAGALGGGISGSGPAVFMLSRDQQTAKTVEAEMRKTYLKTGIRFETYMTTINPAGVKIIES